MARGALTPAEWLTLLAERAQTLRQAGVLEFDLDGCRATLAPAAVVAAEAAAPATEEPSDPMENPATYGLPPGSPIPGYRFERDDEAEA